jgi:hypothetical protein
MAAVWYALEPRQGATHSADTGAMGLLAPLVFLLTASLVAALAAASSVLGAFAGYWAARTGSPLVGALAGLAISALAAGVLVVLLPAAAGSAGAGWKRQSGWCRLRWQPASWPAGCKSGARSKSLRHPERARPVLQAEAARCCCNCPQSAQPVVA